MSRLSQNSIIAKKTSYIDQQREINAQQRFRSMSDLSHSNLRDGVSTKMRADYNKSSEGPSEITLITPSNMMGPQFGSAANNVDLMPNLLNQPPRLENKSQQLTNHKGRPTPERSVIPVSALAAKRQSEPPRVREKRPIRPTKKLF